MSANAENIKNQINEWVRNYPLEAFQNMRMNAILLQMVDLADASTGGTGGTGSIVVELRSSNFTTETDCPLTTLAGKNIVVFLSDIQRFLYKDEGEWTDLVGGGFRVLIDGFNALTTNYHVYVFVL
jgi:hypothetical protein